MGRRKIDYIHHILNTVCTYMPLNGASKKEIIDDVKKKLKRRTGEDVIFEVRKALSAGLRSEILEKQNGKYKLKISTIREKFRDTDIIPIDDRRRPHCTSCGTKIFLDGAQRLKPRRELRAMTVIGDHMLTVKGDEVVKPVEAKSRKNIVFTVVDDNFAKTSSSKGVAVIKTENGSSSSHRGRKTKSPTRKVRRHIYTEHHASRQQVEQQQQQFQQQLASSTNKKLSVTFPVPKMNNHDMAESNAINEYDQNVFSLDDVSGFKQRTNQSHSDQFSFL